MAQVRFWRGEFSKFSGMEKEDSTVYFVSNITVGMVPVKEGEEPKPYSAIYIGGNLIASSQTCDIDMSSIESIVGNIADLDSPLGGLTVVGALNKLLELKSAQDDLIGANAGEIALLKTAIANLESDIADNTAAIGVNAEAIAANTAAIGVNGEAISALDTRVQGAESSIASVSEIVGDGVFTSEALVGKSVTAAINSLGDIIGNTVEGSIGNLEDIHTDIQASDIVQVINKLDDKVLSIETKESFDSVGTADSYQMPASYTRLTYAQVKGKTAEEILDMMLFPDTVPTQISDATIGLSVAGQTAYMEIGASFNPLLTANYNQGSIQVPNVASTVKKYRGPATGYIFSGPAVNATEQVGNTQQLSGYKIVSGANTWGVKVNFGIGEMPITAKGNDYPSARGAAGNKTSDAVTVTGVYPVFTNKTTITNLTAKEALVADSTKSFDVTFAQANTADNRFKIAVAATRGALTKVELWNALSKEFVVQTPMPFEKLAEQATIQVQGVDVKYNVWSCTETAVGGGAIYRFTFA